MQIIRKFRLAHRVWLVATLAVLALGFATLIWQWRNAHNAPSKHFNSARIRHHGLRNNPAETAAVEKRGKR
jgi:hypothetical protein